MALDQDNDLNFKKRSTLIQPLLGKLNGVSGNTLDTDYQIGFVDADPLNSGITGETLAYQLGTTSEYVITDKYVDTDSDFSVNPNSIPTKAAVSGYTQNAFSGGDGIEIVDNTINLDLLDDEITEIQLTTPTYSDPIVYPPATSTYGQKNSSQFLNITDLATVINTPLGVRASGRGVAIGNVAINLTTIQTDWLYFEWVIPEVARPNGTIIVGIVSTWGQNNGSSGFQEALYGRVLGSTNSSSWSSSGNEPPVIGSNTGDLIVGFKLRNSTLGGGKWAIEVLLNNNLIFQDDDLEGINDIDVDYPVYWRPYYEGFAAGSEAYLRSGDSLIYPIPANSVAWGNQNSQNSYIEFIGGKTKVKVLDENDLNSNSNEHLATQQNIKAYSDNRIASQLVHPLISSPTINENGLSISWNNSLNAYELTRPIISLNAGDGINIFDDIISVDLAGTTTIITESILVDNTINTIEVGGLGTPTIDNSVGNVSVSGFGNANGNITLNTGRVYFEWQVTTNVDNSNLLLGVADPTNPNSEYFVARLMLGSLGTEESNTGNVTSDGVIAVGQTLGFDIDIDSGNVTLYEDGIPVRTVINAFTPNTAIAPYYEQFSGTAGAILHTTDAEFNDPTPPPFATARFSTSTPVSSSDSFLEFDNTQLRVKVLDEDNFASNSDEHLATQQSIKNYIDTQISGVTLTSGDGIDLTSNIISIDLQPDSGLTTAPTGIAIDPSVAGNGLSFNSGVFNLGGTLTNSFTLDGSQPIQIGLNTNITGFEVISDGTIVLDSVGDDTIIKAASLDLQAEFLQVLTDSATVQRFSVTQGRIIIGNPTNRFTQETQIWTGASSGRGLLIDDNSPGGIIVTSNTQISLLGNTGIDIYCQDDISLTAADGDMFISLNPAAGMRVSDLFNSKGLEYVADYSAQNTGINDNPRWIPDKGHIDNRLTTLLDALEAQGVINTTQNTNIKATLGI